MKIIKRNGSEADFDLNKIVVAVSKANAACRKEELTQSQIVEIAEYVEFKMSKANRALSVEEIQDIVENQIMAQGAFEVARLYVKYRYNRSLIRKANPPFRPAENRREERVRCLHRLHRCPLRLPHPRVFRY